MAEEDLKDGEREALGLGKDTLQQLGFGFADPGGEHPRPSRHFKSSLNPAAVGEKKHELSLGGGDPRVDLSELGIDLNDDIPSNYSDIQVQETKSGHVMLFDDTPGGERILIKHANGSGIELRHDGSVIIRTEHNLIQSVGGTGAIIIEGDLKISTKNLEWDVAGDFKLNVGGDYLLNIAGDERKIIDGTHRTEVGGNFGTIIKGNKSETILKTRTDTVLGNTFESVKGNQEELIGGTLSIGSTGFFKMTSETEFAASAPNVNIAGADVSVLGDFGTIGGQNVIMYAYNAWIGHSLHATDTVETGTLNAERANLTSGHATTFHGSLVGNADTATTAPDGPAGSTTNVSGTDTDPDTTATAQPTAAIMTSYLGQSVRGIRKIVIDAGNYLFNKIDISERTDGIAKRPLTLGEARSKLKDPLNAGNNKFVSDLIGREIISSDIGNTVPPSIGRSSSADGSLAMLPEKVIRSGSGQGGSKLVSGLRSNRTIFPDLQYNPNAIANSGPKSINSQTLVGKGIPIAAFLSGPGGSTTLNHIASYADRQALARQLLLQTEVMNICKNHTGRFRNFKCIVAEGVYKPEANEVLTPGSVKDLARTGVAITYELYDQDNRSYPDVTFEFAEYLAEFMSSYDKIVLNYDQFDPNSDDVNSQIIVIMPTIDENYATPGDIPPAFAVETRFNNRVLSNSDLVEVLKSI